MLSRVFDILFALGSAALVVATTTAELARSADPRVNNANMFMDTVLVSRLPNQIRIETLDPFQLDTVSVKTTTTNWAGRKFKANFTTNSVTGLSKGVTRLGDCAPVGMRSGNVTIGCNIQFREVHISLDGVGKGDTALNKNHRVTATATLANSYALLEAGGPKPHENGDIVRFVIPNLNFTISRGSEIDLNKDRGAELDNLIKKELTTRIGALLHGKFLTALALAVKSVNLPPV